MSIKGITKEIKKVLAYGSILFIIISGIYLSISMVVQVKSNHVRKTEVLKNEERLVNVEKTIISNRINRLVSDTLYIADSLSFHDFTSNNYEDVEEQWKAFSDRKEIYDQIRYIDIDGNEIIRIDYSQDGAYVTSTEELQNKKDRYYFSDTIVLDKNKVYISKIDLNVENDVIEQPSKSMIRISTPFYGTDKKLKGIVILNYSAEDMLQQIENVASTSQGHIFLLNSDGYWVYNGENHDKEWTFMYKETENISFKNEFPTEWNHIKAGKSGSISTSKGFFSYSKVITSNEFSIGNSKNEVVLGESDWTIVSAIFRDSKNNNLFLTTVFDNVGYVISKSILVLLLIFVIAGVLAILMTMNDMSKEKIRYFSEFDVMTGVYNRRTGFERINKSYKEAVKNGGKISACFIDINGLKEVNDNLGHEAGDELILTIVNGIKNGIRESDIVSRLGGDEFLIIFNDSNQEEAENSWQQINEEYQKINNNEDRKYVISVSHGIEEFKFNTDEYIDTVINAADEKMYNEKRIIKRDLEVIRGKRGD